MLYSLRPNQHTIHLISSEYPIDNVATRIPDNTDMATVTNGETLKAIATGTCLSSVRLDGYAITLDTVVVHIRQPLWALRFAPTWHDSLFTHQPYRSSFVPLNLKGICISGQSTANARRLTAQYGTPLQAWPNPFNATTTLRFHLQTTGSARIALYNLQGWRNRTLVDEILNACSQQILWNDLDQYGHTIATGLYFARLTTLTSQHQSKILLLR
ncbi:MAG: T9SS type A sorting domain-containing protein [Candidatus Latescibacterota bacterium]